jgi:hypothetical protein
MKVRIMDYETAKAKVLAREQNPCIANERHVYGVDKTWAGWGQVRDVHKHISGFRDVEDGYDLPLYLIDKVTDKDVLRYGEIINDESYILYSGQNVRIRIISYNDYIYYHKMADGEIVDFKPIGLVLK